MRILVAVHHFPPKYTAGAEWQAYRLAQGLIGRGHDIRVIAIEHVDRGAADGSLVWEDTSYQGVPVRKLAFDQARVPDPDRYEFRNLWIRDHFNSLFREMCPQLVHLVSGYLLTGAVLEAAEAQAIPRVVNVIDFWFMCRRITLLRSNGDVTELPIQPEACVKCLAEERFRNRVLGSLLPGLMRRYYAAQTGTKARVVERLTYLRERLNAADQLIVNSRFLYDALVQFGVQPERIEFLRQGLDLAALAPGTSAKPLADVFRVGYFGQIAPQKGVHVLIEAARKVADPRLRVVIYGDASRFPHYTAHLKRLIGGDPRITFAGMYQGVAEQAVALAAIDVVVVPSIWYENSPNIILESYAHRTPVIASDWGGMAELVEPGRGGLKFPPGDSSALASLLERFFAEPSLLAQLNSDFPPVSTLDQELDRTEVIYRRLLAIAPPITQQSQGRS